MGKQKSFIIVGSTFIGIILLIILVSVITRGIKDTKCNFEASLYSIEIGKSKALTPTLYAGGVVKEMDFTYTAETERVLATVPIGYADGYSRALSSKANMIVNGHYAPVVGRVCMDQLMIDVTGIPNVKMGTEVIVVGTDGDKHVTFDDLAAILGTINYELPCVLPKRVPRIYKENGEIVGIVDHILHQYK